MPMSPYVRSLRAQVGHEFLLLPGVTAVIRDRDRFLLARQRDTERWSLIGGGVEPGETPQQAVAREVLEEIGVEPAVGGIVGAYGGAMLESTYPNGDRVGYVTVAFICHIPETLLTLETDEILETRWASWAEARDLTRHAWIDAVLDDVVSSTA